MLVISGIKLDELFSVGQFRIPGYTSPFCLDPDQHSREIMVFIREDIPVKFLSADTKLIEILYFKFSQKKAVVQLLI